MHRVWTIRTIVSSSAQVSFDAGTVSYGVPVSVHSLRFSLSSRRGRERVLFIGTQFSILYTSMYSPAEAATPRAWCLWFRESMYTGVHRFLTAAVCQQLLVRVMPAQTPLRQQRIICQQTREGIQNRSDNCVGTRRNVASKRNAHDDVALWPGYPLCMLVSVHQEVLVQRDKELRLHPITEVDVKVRAQSTVQGAGQAPVVQERQQRDNRSVFLL